MTIRRRFSAAKNVIRRMRATASNMLKPSQSLANLTIWDDQRIWVAPRREEFQNF
jgi:hypothetical protein